MQIAGFDIIQLVGVVVALLSIFVAARSVPRILAKIFEKTAFPEKIESAIVRVSKLASTFNAPAEKISGEA